MFSNGVSLADIAAVTDRNDNNGFGDGGGWWAWIILFALFGWGGGGFGFGGNGANTQSSFTDAAIQRGFDNQTIVGKLDGITQGISTLGYDQLAQMNGLNTNIMQGNFGIQGAINGLSSQLADCCCTTQRSIDQVRFDNAQNTCAITNGMASGFAQLDRTINDKFCELEMRQLQTTIDEQRSLIQSLSLAQSQNAQTQQLMDTLRPCPTPAYITCNPWASNGTAYTTGYGNGGCGCGC